MRGVWLVAALVGVLLVPALAGNESPPSSDRQARRAVSIAILDSGVAGFDLAPQVVATERFTFTRDNASGLFVRDKPYDDGQADEACGHGNATTHIAAASAPTAGILVLKIAKGPKCLGDPMGIPLAIDWIVQNAERYHIRVISYSYGGTGSLDDPVVAAARRAVAAGLVFVAASGRSVGVADARDVISVGARGGLTSGAAGKPDIIVRSREAPSLAAPDVAAAVARLLQKDPTMSPSDVLAVLCLSADRATGDRGCGALDAERAISIVKRPHAPISRIESP